MLKTNSVFTFFRNSRSPPALPPRQLILSSEEAKSSVEVVFKKHPRARRYLLRLVSLDQARVTIPRGGTVTAAWSFVQRNVGWLERQLKRQRGNPQASSSHRRNWGAGDALWFRGEQVLLQESASGEVMLGDERISVGDGVGSWRVAIERHLRRLAERELPPQLQHLATRHGIVVHRVSVRNQKTRWGSCSRRGTISLNWRLVQTPEWVRDYIMLHELAHRREMNHSGRFWRVVEDWCPDYARAEQWLKEYRNFLRE